jgi:MFS family permease
LQDHIGRRLTLLTSWGVTTLGILGISISSNITMFIVFTIIAGFGVNGAFNVCFVILNEACGNSFRQKASIALLIVFALTEIFCAVIFYLMYNWRELYIIFTAVPSVAAFILCFWIYETPKFYLTKNKSDLVNLEL